MLKDIQPIEKKPIQIDAGEINRDYEYSQDRVMDALLKQLRYIKWQNVDNM